MSLAERFDAAAKAAGATHKRDEFYPNDSSMRRQVFAVRYFDDDLGEVAYWMPSMEGHLTIFNVPRVWGAGAFVNCSGRYDL